MSAEAPPPSENVSKEAVVPPPPPVQSSSRTSTYDVHLKPEYILESCHPCLAPPLERKPADNDPKPNKKQSKRNRHKKNVKDSFKRGREGDTLSDMKVCKDFMLGKPCKRGDTCKFSHDMKEMLSLRDDDIQGVKGGCPHYNLYGQCPHGITCRVGKEHLNLSTGENFSKLAVEKEETVKNCVSFDMLTLLRKNQYNFTCKRYSSKKNQGNKNAEKEAKVKEEEEKKVTDVGEDEASKTTESDKAVKIDPGSIDLSPLPKMKKLIDFRNKVYGKFRLV